MEGRVGAAVVDTTEFLKFRKLLTQRSITFGAVTYPDTTPKPVFEKPSITLATFTWNWELQRGLGCSRAEGSSRDPREGSRGQERARKL